MGVLGQEAVAAWWEEVGDWRDVAACHGEPVEVFFPSKGGRFDRGKRLCARCTVAGECRRFVDEVERRLTTTEIHGLYGGESPNERIRRRTRETAAVTASLAGSPT